MKRVVSGLVVLAFAGCSFLAVNGPDIAPGTMPGPGESIDCTESRIAPIVDITLGALFLAGAVSAFIDSRSPDGRPQAGEAAAAILAVALVFGTSAFVGLRRVGDCRDAHETYMR